MGTDVHGYVEAYDRGLGWRAVVNIGPLTFWDYETFGLLFGVRRLNYLPVAACRGLPDDASREARQDYQYGEQIDKAVGNATWILWKEIAAVDWEAQARQLNQRWEAQFRQLNQREKPLSTWTMENEWECYFEHLKRFIKGAKKRSRKNGITAIDWEAQTRNWERAVAERKEQGNLLDAPLPDWQFIFYLMEQLAVKYEPQHVRLVVWFDG